MHQLKKIAMDNSMASNRVLSTLGEEDDDIPDLIGQNFESQLAAEVNIDDAINTAQAPQEVVD